MFSRYSTFFYAEKNCLILNTYLSNNSYSSIKLTQISDLVKTGVHLLNPKLVLNL